jgi:hypothetical protein
MRKAVTGEWREVHNAQLSDLNSSPRIFLVIIKWRMICGEQIACMAEKRGAYRILVRKVAGEIFHIRSWARRRLNGMFKNGIRFIGRIDLPQDIHKWLALFNAVTNLWVP